MSNIFLKCKKSFSILMVFTLVSLSFVTTIPQKVYANQDSVSTQAQESTESFATTKSTASKKAEVLTSMYGISSIQYALIDNGELVLSSQTGVNRTNSKTPLSANTLYGIGSISKIFTTVAIMQLVEQGLVDLDKPVIDYIPEFKMADSRYIDITVRMLLNHSSGLMGSTLNNSLLFGDRDFSTYSTLLETLSTSRLKANPGAYSVYCNDGFTLAELIVEKVTGLSFTTYIDKYISTPLNLNNTTTPIDTFERMNLAGTYSTLSKAPLPSDSLNMIGAGGIYSTAEELCYFSELFMSRNTKTNVLSYSSAKAMEYPEYKRGIHPKNGTSFTYGLGWDSMDTAAFSQYGIKALIKGGDTYQYHGSLIVLPEENIAIALLSSGGSSAHNQVMGQEILLTYLEEKGRIERKAEETTKLPEKATMPATYKKYEGIYGTSGGLIQVKISSDGTLTLSSENSKQSIKHIYTGDGKFYYTDGSYYYSFVEESNGLTYLYCNSVTSLPGIGKYISSDYQAQKLEENKITPEVKKIWEERSGKKYFIVSEKYSSQSYARSCIMALQMSKTIEGYWLDAKIIDENTAKSVIQIPGVYGRDLMDYEFIKINNQEYLKSGNYLFISEDKVKQLPSTTKFYAFDKNAYANWFKITKKTAGKKIRLINQGHVSMGVYNKDGVCLSFSPIDDNYTFTLPEEGYVVFAGEAGATYTVTYLY